MSNSAGNTAKGEHETGRADPATADFSIDQAPPGDFPQRIGRYRVDRVLGMGGFGMVFLAHDDQLSRLVAIKVPHARRLSRPEDAAPYLSEARTVASLDHPHIVPVFDMGSTTEFPCFVVSKYIDGTNLAERLKLVRFTWVEAAELVVTLAEALHYAHRQGLVHRDVKPGNILIDRLGQPFVVDFGLALRDQQADNDTSYAGTPAYMSPEQARGEGHRVDGRSDIFSLGVVLYELLTGRKPFYGETRAVLLTQITGLDPKPPRQIADAIPRELERICLRALAKRATDRYTTAMDFADDLRNALAQGSQTDVRPTGLVSSESSSPGSVTLPVASSPATTALSASQAPRIVPKGLRSFDEHDADFFLELLPGPRDRNGLPDSIRCWKARIEEASADTPFTVGLIYGPSGCGKSSLVKAGLLPRLSDNVISLYIEATPEETEARLLYGLRKCCRVLDGGLNLKEALLALRRGQGLPSGKKLLIVIDQFEQWLHARKDGEAFVELVEALRQCDGDHVQCLVLVRDDFYVAVNRFFRQLEVPILEGHNYALVDLFDLDHARRVLGAFGRAYGKLPESMSAASAEQQAFLSQAIGGLAQDGKVISVRLALFAEMMKGRTWTPASLRDVGGTEGVGVTFLEETFSAQTAPPTHRLHQRAVREVLKALLPDAGTDIKGQMQPFEKLLDVSGYAKHPADFQALLAILESDVRLMAPTEPGGDRQADSAADAFSDKKYYQLTHDFLIPALRDWLTRKQRETARGRAELRLAERTALWTRRREPKQLPSAGETLNILALTRRSTWTGSQLQMMRLAVRRHALRLAGGIGLAVLIAVTAAVQKRRSNHQDEVDRGNQLVDTLLLADAGRLPALLTAVRDFPEVPFERLRRIAHSAGAPASERLRAHLALVAGDRQSIPFLLDELQTADLREYAVIRAALSQWKSEVAPRLWPSLRQEALAGARRLRVAGALSEFDPEGRAWPAVAESVCKALVDENPAGVFPWVEILLPVRGLLSGPLTERFRDAAAPASVRVIAAGILARFAGDEPAILAELIVEAEPEQFELLLGPLQKQGAQAQNLVEERLASLAAPDQTAPRDRLVRGQAIAALALMRMGRPDPAWRYLDKSPEPDVRTELIFAFHRYHVGARDLVARLTAEREPTARYALLLALGEYDSGGLNETDRRLAVDRVRELYFNDPDAGVHGAATWLLGVWKQPVAPLKAAPEDAPRWHVTSEGHVMCELEGPITFQMGSPTSEADRDHIEGLHEVHLTRGFAIAAREVTIDEFLRFAPAHAYAPEIGPEGSCPVNRSSWIDAARYCNWLTLREGLSEDELVYPALATLTEGVRVPAENIKRRGYRLPTEEEWEFACRANARTKWSFGESDGPLPRFGRYLANSDEHTWPVGQMRPNAFGLFDTYGNVHEWCHDTYDGSELVSAGVRADVELGGPDVRPGERFFRGGSYRSMKRLVRTAKRYSYPPNTNLSPLGFRIARTLPD